MPCIIFESIAEWLVQRPSAFTNETSHYIVLSFSCYGGEELKLNVNVWRLLLTFFLCKK